MIVTGSATGRQASPEDVRAAADAVAIPVLVGSGITLDNINRYPTARGFIVGSAVKQGGDWRQPLDPERTEAIAAAFHAVAGVTR